MQRKDLNKKCHQGEKKIVAGREFEHKEQDRSCILCAPVRIFVLFPTYYMIYGLTL
jgi:hypothetical protein